MEETLTKSNGTTCLDLSKQGLSHLFQTVCQAPLISYLNKFKQLKMLDLSSNKLTCLVPPPKEGMKEHLQGILSSVQSLNLSDNPVNNVR